MILFFRWRQNGFFWSEDLLLEEGEDLRLLEEEEPRPLEQEEESLFRGDEFLFFLFEKRKKRHLLWKRVCFFLGAKCM